MRGRIFPERGACVMILTLRCSVWTVQFCDCAAAFVYDNNVYFMCVMT